MKRTPQKGAREVLRDALHSVSLDINDVIWNLEQIEIHLAAHFASEVDWPHWDALHRLGATTGNDMDHENGRYPISVVRNLRHHRAQLHRQLHTFRLYQTRVQVQLDTLTVTLPGFEQVLVEREAAQIAANLTTPIACKPAANSLPLFDIPAAPSAQGSLF